ncbi:unnamed protein product [Trifolium pratense]|uniref:Uncharacterized protein n=1 Tax=Trifolium pratense TaxID=57577 RepID=A0ACB0IY19_TRIPR|nr:unnamed protein product [Trifolium pratense]
MDDRLEVVVHHGGWFEEFDHNGYVGADVSWFVDEDYFSYFEFVGEIKKKLKYPSIDTMWFYDPQDVNELVLLEDDMDANRMKNIARMDGRVHLYLMHPMAEPEFIEAIEYGPIEGVNENGPAEGVNENGPAEGVKENGPVEGVNEYGPTDDLNDNGPSEGVNETGPTGPTEGDKVGPTADAEGDKVGPTAEKGKGVRIDDDVIDDLLNEVEYDEDSEDSALGIHFDDSEEDCLLEDNFDTVADETVVDENVVDEPVTKGKGKKGKKVRQECNVSKPTSKKGRPKKKNNNSNIYTVVQGAQQTAQGDELFEEDVGNIDKSKYKAFVGGLSDIEDYNSEELDSGSDSDIENEVEDSEDEDEHDTEWPSNYKLPTFKMPSSMRDYKWESGMYFACKQEFQEAIRCYAIQSQRAIKYKKNDKKRIRLICKSGCVWNAYCSHMPGQETWQLMFVKDEHKCNREPKVKMLSAKWLGKRLHKKVKENPNLKLIDIMEKTQQKWNLKISKNKASKARGIAFDLVDGSFREQYTRFYDYSHELLRSNRGSTVIVTTTPFQGDEADLEHPERPLCPHFQRAYICFKGCKESFLICRPIIGLDGAFLKGYYGGQILAAIGRDPNDQMLPIAIAVVEGETKETWKWFLELLTNDLGGTRACSLITFISDQQKGLLPAMDELLPGVAHRFCVRHLYNNFKKKFPGKKLKELMWKAANATYVNAWHREMQEIKTINIEAFKHLIKIPPRHWSKSYFTPEAKCDTLVNNMSEAFNSVIVGARAKPIVTMLEEIRVYMMERWETNRQKIGRYVESILPNIKKKLERETSFSNNWMVRPAGYELFEVRHISASGDHEESFSWNCLW